MPNITLLINLALSTNYRFLISYECTLARILSTSPLHSIFINLLAVMGTPRYLSGKLLSCSPVISRHFYCIAWEYPSNTIYDLAKFTFSPAHSWISWRAVILSCKEAGWALLKRMRLSTNMRCVSPSCLQWGWNLNSCCWLTYLSSLDKYSIVSTKRREERGSPCLSPFPPIKGSLTSPFMCMENYTEATHAIIHLVNCKGNFRAISISWTNP